LANTGQAGEQQRLRQTSAVLSGELRADAEKVRQL
jgi:hypothetical protein